MKRGVRNTKFLENLVEVSHMLLSDNRFQQSFCNGDDCDSVAMRFAAIDAALAFDSVETNVLKKADRDFANNYDWLHATGRFVELVIDKGNGTESRNRKLAKQAIAET